MGDFIHHRNTPCTSETSLYAVFEEQAPPFNTRSHGFLIVGEHPQSRSELSSKPGTDSVENEWRSVCHAASLCIKTRVFSSVFTFMGWYQMSEGRWGVWDGEPEGGKRSGVIPNGDPKISVSI